MTNWTALSARAAFASHRLVAWIYWDPAAIEERTQLDAGGSRAGRRTERIEMT